MTTIRDGQGNETETPTLTLPPDFAASKSGTIYLSDEPCPYCMGHGKKIKIEVSK